MGLLALLAADQLMESFLVSSYGALKPDIVQFGPINRSVRMGGY